VNCGVDKWQTLAFLPVQNPAYRGNAFPLLFHAVKMKKQTGRVAKTLYHAIRFFTAKRVMAKAAALTYNTLLAIVPIMAVVFAIARGFGYNKYIESWFRELLSTQPQAAEVIIGWVNSYLIHTQSGIFLGVGLLFMLYTVLMLVNNIEQTFNEIWQVRQSRSMVRSFSNYMATFFLLPILIVVFTGLSMLMTTMTSTMPDLLSTVVRQIVGWAPYMLMSLLFIGLYILMPNTKVRWQCAVVPGLLAGIAMQVLQVAYVHSQIWVTGYNAIYGSFAALPLFMLWIQASWTICLFGAELTFANQNLGTVGLHTELADFHPYVEMGDDELDERAIAMYADGIDGL